MRVVLVGVVAGLALAPVLLPWATHPSPESAGFVPDPGNLTRVADLVGFVVPGPLHPLWGESVQPVYWWLSRFHEGFTTRPDPLEQLVFPGFAALVCAVVGARSGEVRHRGLLVWIALAFAALSLGDFLHVAGFVFVGVEGETLRGLGLDRALRALGYGGSALGIPMPHWVVSRVPGLGVARAPCRMIVVSLLAMAPLVAAGARVAADRWAPRLPVGDLRGRWLVFAAITSLVVFEGLALPLNQVDAGYSPTMERIREQPGRLAVLNVPPVPRGSHGTPILGRYMYEQTIHHRPIVSGSIARMPEDAFRVFETVPLLTALRDPGPGVLAAGGLSDAGLALAASGTAVMDSLGIGYAVLHKGLYFDGDDASRTRLGAPAAYYEPSRALLEAAMGPPCHEDERVAVYAPHECGSLVLGP
jgi:hypothetical protein